jgi:hypothetical protein
MIEVLIPWESFLSMIHQLFVIIKNVIPSNKIGHYEWIVLRTIVNTSHTTLRAWAFHSKFWRCPCSTMQNAHISAWNSQKFIYLHGIYLTMIHLLRHRDLLIHAELIIDGGFLTHVNLLIHDILTYPCGSHLEKAAYNIDGFSVTEGCPGSKYLDY